MAVPDAAAIQAGSAAADKCSVRAPGAMARGGGASFGQPLYHDAPQRQGATEGNICFVVKDNEEVLFFMKNSESGKENVSAMWTNSNAMIYSKKLLFDLLWSKSKSIPL